jgi:HEAT repeat protein
MADEEAHRRESEIVALLRDEDTGIGLQRELVKELRRVGSDASVGVLRESLASRDIELSGQTVRTLARIGTDEAIDALCDALELPSGPRLILAASTFRKQRAARARPAIIRCLQTRGEALRPDERRILVLALGEMPHVSAVPVLAMALRERRYRMRTAAAWALAQIRAPESEAALEEVTNELSWLRARPIRRGLRARKQRADQG